jgi:hypothetical protein
MTHALVGRCDAPTAQRRAPAAELAIVGVPSVLIAILPPVRNRLGRFVRRWLHASEPAAYGAHCAHVQPRHRRFGPCQALQRGALVYCGALVGVWRTVGRIEHRARLRQQGLDVLPSPFGPIGSHTEPHVPCRHHPCVCHLPERLATLLLRLHVMPTQERHAPITIQQREATALGIPPLPPPPRPLGPPRLRPRVACSPRVVARRPTPSAPGPSGWSRCASVPSHMARRSEREQVPGLCRTELRCPAAPQPGASRAVCTPPRPPTLHRRESGPRDRTGKRNRAAHAARAPPWCRPCGRHVLGRSTHQDTSHRHPGCGRVHRGGPTPRSSR